MTQINGGIDRDASPRLHATLDAHFGGLEGRDLLEPLITRVYPGRIALVSSFGAESVLLLHMVWRWAQIK